MATAVMPKRPRVIFMAFGTLGDVCPLAAVAVGLANTKPQCLIFFITHSAHKSLMKVLSASNVTFFPITSPPVLPASYLDEYVQATVLDESRPQFEFNKETNGDSWKSKNEEQHRQECLAAVDKVLGSEQQHGDYIIINFFALEGWHLAEFYQVPCAVAAPYVVPYSAPVSFERRFIKSHPLLYDKLKRGIHGMVGWEDVMHWMWPLFTERWTEWRVKKLHLSPCPLTDPVTELPVVHNWPAEPLLLYGFSKEVVECPSYWPSNAHVCGFWFLEPHVQESECLQCASPELVAFLKESIIPPIFVGLSSIGSMGFLHNPEGMLCVLARTLKASDRKAVLFTAAYAPLDAAVLAAATEDVPAVSMYGATEVIGSRAADAEHYKGQSDYSNILKNGVCLFGDRLFCFSGSVPYLWLFPKCSLIIHHGGSGTTAAALQSGIPQVICPFVLDQFYWAERMAWIGVAPEPLKRQYLIPLANSDYHEAVRSLLHAIQEASNPRLQACAVAFGDKIRMEDGVGFAVGILSKNMITKC